MALLFKLVSQVVEIIPSGGKAFSLEEIKDLVEDTKGDGIDAIGVGKHLVMFVRENSFWECPVNQIATHCIRAFNPDYQFTVHGIALLCTLVESGDSE